MGQQRWQLKRRDRQWLLPLLAIVTTVLCGLGLPAISATTPPAASSAAIAPTPATAVAQAEPSQAGKTFYDAGQFDQAAAALEQAVAQLRSPVQPVPLAAALANLALAYQQLGQWDKATQAIDESLQWLNGQPQDSQLAQVKAQALEIAGRLQLAQGDSNTALSLWQQAEATYRQAQNPDGIINAQLNQAQALRSLGFYRRALDQLQSASQSLRDRPDTRQKALILRALGDTLQLVGNLDEAQRALEHSLAIAQKLELPTEQASTLLSLGNTRRAQRPDRNAETNINAAIAYYQQAAALNASPITTIQAQLNQLNLVIDRQVWSDVQLLLPQIAPALDQLPPSRTSVYARINFAQALLRLGQPSVAGNPPAATPTIPAASPFAVIPYPQSLSQLLRTNLQAAIQQAHELKDRRAESYALGTLGAVYEATQQYAEAETVTRQALILAQSNSTWDIAYRWQWQLGRLLQRNPDDLTEAISAYDAAVENLRSLRGDLAAVNQDVQFNFREQVEPVYRQSVELLLKAQETIQGQDKESQGEKEELLNKARERIEALQLAELDNFFREACLEGQRVILDQVVDQENPTTAIIYPIVLREQNNVAIKTIAKIPGQRLKAYSKTLSLAEFDQTLQALQDRLADAPSDFATGQLQDTAKVIYDWLIKPIEADLPTQTALKPKANLATPEAQAIDTLVFILDDALRNVPLALLWDGEKYLVEKYAIGLSVGLQLLAPAPIARTNLRVLAAGLSEPPKPYEPLPLVKDEINAIAGLGLTLTPLFENQFTRQALETKITADPYNVVHLATHGEFGSRAEDTYILAADGVINVTEFDTLLRSRDVTRPEAIELLVFSACQTATNDRRATLGLAGFAVRAGARSTLASLRNASDESTVLLMEEFYRQLSNAKEPVTKAEALRRAQLTLLKGTNLDYQKPRYWAPYVLVGNWL